MFYFEDNNYIPLLAVTIASTSKEIEKTKILFNNLISTYSTNQIIELFSTHEYCNSLTIQEYIFYQYYYGLCLIDKTQNDNSLGIQLQKLFRNAFPDIYRIVRKSKKFNIMDYYFLKQETQNLSIISKMDFSNKAVALMLFILNKWGKSDAEAFSFARALYEIVIADKNRANNAVTRELLSNDTFKRLKNDVTNQILQQECEAAIEQVFEMFFINFEMIYADIGLDVKTLTDMHEINKIVCEQFSTSEEAIHFLNYNLSLVLNVLEKYMLYIKDNNVFLTFYQNDKLQKEIAEKEKRIHNDKEEFKKRFEYNAEKVQKLAKQIDELTLKNSKLQSIISEQQQTIKETSALRSYIYQLGHPENFSVQKTIDWSLLNQIDGVIVGGSDNWQRKLKKKLSNWRFISASMEQYDKSLITNCDYVFVNTSFIGHSLYYKISSMVQATDGVKMGFINNLNIDRVYREIFNQIE